MKAVVIRSTGDENVLRLEQLDRPQPADGEVLIRVRAATVNPIDWKYRRGLVQRPLPAVLGEDVSGTIEVSPVAEFEPGDGVIGITSSGGYAEYATASLTAIAHKPPVLSYEHGAALPVSGLTAWQGLFGRGRGRLGPGQTVLIAGAAGGVGHLGIQFAKLAGARVIATGSSRSRDFAFGLGVDDFIDYAHDDVAAMASEIDLVLDTVGGSTTASLLATLRAGGTLVTIAYPPQTPPQDERIALEPLAMTPSSTQLARIAELAASGAVRVEIARRMPLGEVRQAHMLSESGHTRGKIILTV